jgi:phosphatidylinositol-3,4,5-trisphosphate 3-phosphatase/dual-specificity protein phosphatase PTEN
MGNFYSNDTLAEVRSFLQKRHDQHYAVYNLSSEPEYNIEQDIENVHNFPFNANNPCALKTLMSICSEIDSFLVVHHQNVAFLHCRTGTSLSVHSNSKLLHCMFTQVWVAVV